MIIWLIVSLALIWVGHLILLIKLVLEWEGWKMTRGRCRCPQCREDTKRLWEKWREKHAPGPWPQPSWWDPKVLRPTDSWFAAFRKGERG